MSVTDAILAQNLLIYKKLVLITTASNQDNFLSMWWLEISSDS